MHECGDRKRETARDKRRTVDTVGERKGRKGDSDTKGKNGIAKKEILSSKVSL